LLFLLLKKFCYSNHQSPAEASRQAGTHASARRLQGPRDRASRGDPMISLGNSHGGSGRLLSLTVLSAELGSVWPSLPVRRSKPTGAPPPHQSAGARAGVDPRLAVQRCRPCCLTATAVEDSSRPQRRDAPRRAHGIGASRSRLRPGGTGPLRDRPPPRGQPRQKQEPLRAE